MAFFIRNLSIGSQFTYDEPITVSFDVGGHSKRIDYTHVTLIFKGQSKNYNISMSGYTSSIPVGKTVRVSVSNTFSAEWLEENYPDFKTYIDANRASILERVFVFCEDGSGNVADSLYPSVKTAFLSSYCKPNIDYFDAVRCDEEGNEDDEGTHLLCSLKISAADFTHMTTLTISCGENTSDIHERISDASVGILSDKDVYTYVVTNTEKHIISVWFGDEYEHDEASVDIQRSFANVHMSGAANGGVCLGGFSTATDEQPKFECYYPSYLYGGIDKIALSKVAEPTYASGFAAYEDHEPKVTRVGCFVFLDGMIKATASKATSAAEGVVMATLPSWACPRVRVNQLMQGSSAAVWWMMVTPESDGTCTVRIARYRQTNSTTYSSVSSGNQLPVTAMWIAADAYDEVSTLNDTDAD